MITDNINNIFPTGKLFRIVWDATMSKLRLLSKDPMELSTIIDNFSDNNPAAFFVKQYGYNVPAKISPINSFGYFPIGLFFEIVRYIKSVYGSLQCIVIDDNTAKIINKTLFPLKNELRKMNLSIDSFEVVNISTTLKLRDYQENIIKNIIFDGFGSGIFESPTSSGKSFILSNYIYTMWKYFDENFRFLILVPNRQLVDQFYKDMLEYGFDESWVIRLAGGIKYKKGQLEMSLGSSRVLISNRQYLNGKLDILPKIDGVIVDELHTAKSTGTTLKIVDDLQPRFRVGCSGTLPKFRYELLTLKGVFGKVVKSENLLDLQKRGFITKLKICRINIFNEEVHNNTRLKFSLNSKYHYNELDDVAFNAAYEEETNYTLENFDRLFIPALQEIAKVDGNTLILFDRIQFGKDLYDHVNGQIPGKRIWYIDGSTPIDIREEMRDVLEKTDNNIVFGQVSILSTGTNIKNLNNLGLFASGKSASRIVQSIGRTLRLHKDKDYAVLFDLAINHKYSQRHKKERDKIYKEVYGKNKPDESITIKI